MMAVMLGATVIVYFHVIMKNNAPAMSYTSSLYLLIGLLTFGSLQAQNTYKVKAIKTTISGTSSLHDWTSESTQGEVTAALELQDKTLRQLKSLQVKIPVASIKSTKGKMMDSKTYEAFKSDKNPNIIYKLSSIKLSGQDNLTLEASGQLTMAGVTKPIELSVRGKILPGGDIQFTGSKKLNMKDFSMEPPTAMMGTIRVGEEVTVAFDLTLTAH